MCCYQPLRNVSPKHHYCQPTFYILPKINHVFVHDHSDEAVFTCSSMLIELTCDTLCGQVETRGSRKSQYTAPIISLHKLWQSSPHANRVTSHDKLENNGMPPPFFPHLQLFPPNHTQWYHICCASLPLLARLFMRTFSWLGTASKCTGRAHVLPASRQLESQVFVSSLRPQFPIDCHH